MATPLLDPSFVRPYWIRHGLSLEILNKCNHQEFKAIGGYGLGYFLTVDDYTPSGPYLEYEVDGETFQLPILNILDLEVEGNNGTHLIVVETAEPKYELKQFVVKRNYNVLDKKSIDMSGLSLSYDTLEPDETPKSIEEIITDILDDSGYSLEYT